MLGKSQIRLSFWLHIALLVEDSEVGRAAYDYAYMPFNELLGGLCCVEVGAKVRGRTGDYANTMDMWLD